MQRFFFYLLLILLPTQLGLHFWPEWSLVLGRKVDYLSPTLFLTDILILFIIVPFVIKNFHSFRFTPLFLLSTFYFLLNIYFSHSPPLAFYGWVKILEFGLLYFYIKKSKPTLNSIFFCLSIAVLYSSLLGIAQTIHGGSIGGIFWFLGERTFTLQTPNIAKGVLCLPNSFSCTEYLRPYATFPHPNVFAGFLALFILLGVKLKKSKILLFLAFAMLILTFSRTAWVALLLTPIVLYTKRPKILLAIIFLLSLIPLPFLGRESIDVRVALNQAAVSIIKNNPIAGVGIKNFLVSLPDFLPTRTIYFLQPVHNIYLLFLAENGLLGAIFLFFYQKRKKLSLFLILFLLIGLFDHYPLTLQQGQLLFVLALALD